LLVNCHIFWIMYLRSLIIDMFESQEKDNKIKSGLDNKSVAEMNELEKNIKNDISHVDNRMSDLQMYITSLDSQIKKLDVMIKNSEVKRRANLYQLLNETLLMIAKFQQIYQTYLQTKFNYRKEHNNFIYRKIKLVEIEMKTATGGDLTPTMLLSLLQELNRKIDSAVDGDNDTVQQSLQELETDNLYKME